MNNFSNNVYLSIAGIDESEIIFFNRPVQESLSCAAGTEI